MKPKTYTIVSAGLIVHNVPSRNEAVSIAMNRPGSVYVCDEHGTPVVQFLEVEA